MSDSPAEGESGFAWRYLDGAGSEVGRSERFSDREAAEAWLGERWSDLGSRGVEEVVLLTPGGDPVYRMALGAG